jgi:hypothetical protein
MGKLAGWYLAHFVAAEQISTGDIVEPHQVQGGKACGCICPSCRTPVLAIKGAERRWHFRHDARAYQQTTGACEYNLHFSVRMLALQLLRQGGVLVLPAFVAGSTAAGSSSSRGAAALKRLEYGAEQVVDCGAGVEADICLQFGKHRLLLRFAYYGRPFPGALRAPADRNCSVLSINLDSILSALSEGEDTGAGLRACLGYELLSSTAHKNWVYHHSQAAVDPAGYRAVRGCTNAKPKAKSSPKLPLSQSAIDAAVAAVLPVKPKK